MTDTTTGRPLRVSADGKAGPYLIVPYGQIADVKRILDHARIRYWVDETAVSMSGGPLLTVINFGKATNADDVQKALNGVS